MTYNAFALIHKLDLDWIVLALTDAVGDFLAIAPGANAIRRRKQKSRMTAAAILPVDFSRERVSKLLRRRFRCTLRIEAIVVERTPAFLELRPCHPLAIVLNAKWRS